MRQLDIEEPVFQQDMDTEQEYATEGWKNFYDFHERLKAQGAPLELLSKVAEITNIYKSLSDGIAAIQTCFPIEKRR